MPSDSGVDQNLIVEQVIRNFNKKRKCFQDAVLFP